MRYRVAGPGWQKDFEVHRDSLAREWQMQSEDGEVHELVVEPVEGRGALHLSYRGEVHHLVLLPGNRPGQPLRFLFDDIYYELQVADPSDLLSEVLGCPEDTSGEVELRSSMPGIIRECAVGPGDEVAAGQRLFVLEAMKMENEIEAPAGGRIESVEVAVGDTINTGDLLVVIIP